MYISNSGKTCGVGYESKGVTRLTVWEYHTCFLVALVNQSHMTLEHCLRFSELDYSLVRCTNLFHID